MARISVISVTCPTLNNTVSMSECVSQDVAVQASTSIVFIDSQY